MPFQFERAAIPDILIVKPRSFTDARGVFLETYQARDFAAAGIQSIFVQDNQSGSRQGVLRGLHYQIRQPQGKLVRALVGEVFDVAVDLRQSSATFGAWVGHRLSAATREQLWIPAGFAHGFYVISEWAEILYKSSDYYAPEWERALRWDDPTVGIEWPISGGPPLVSEKDGRGSWLAEAETYE